MFLILITMILHWTFWISENNWIQISRYLVYQRTLNAPQVDKSSANQRSTLRTLLFHWLSAQRLKGALEKRVRTSRRFSMLEEGLFSPSDELIKWNYEVKKETLCLFNFTVWACAVRAFFPAEICLFTWTDGFRLNYFDFKIKV